MSQYRCFSGRNFTIKRLVTVNGKVQEETVGFIKNLQMSVSGDGILKAKMESIKEDLSSKEYVVIDMKVDDQCITVIVDEYKEIKNG